MAQKKHFAFLVPGMNDPFMELKPHLKEQLVEAWCAQNCAETDSTCKLARKRMMARRTLGFSTQATGAKRSVTRIYIARGDFLVHYRNVSLELELVPLTATSVTAAKTILNLMIVAMVVVDQRNGNPAVRNVLERVQNVQPRALALVIAQDSGPDFRGEALALDGAVYLGHPAVPDGFARALQWVYDSVEQ